MEAFLGSALVALSSALAFVAYRHHSAFARIADRLFVASIATILVLNAWNLGARVGSDAAILAVASGDLAAARAATENVMVPWRHLLLGGTAWMIFLFVLRFLPNILDLLGEFRTTWRVSFRQTRPRSGRGVCREEEAILG